jgi:hypothetical protein
LWTDETGANKQSKTHVNYGFLLKLSESGPKTKGPNQVQEIIVMSNWLSTTFVVPIETPQCAQCNMSIANATTDIRSHKCDKLKLRGPNIFLHLAK